MTAKVTSIETAKAKAKIKTKPAAEAEPNQAETLEADPEVQNFANSANRPEVFCNAANLPEVVDQCLDILAANATNPEADSHYFQSEDRIVRITTLTQQEVDRAPIKYPVGAIIQQAASVHGLEDDLERAIPFIGFRDGKPIACGIPKKVASRILSRAKTPLLNIVGVVETPIMDYETGKILMEPGYDKNTGLFFHTGVNWPPVKSQPTATDVKNAKQVLAEPFAEFPFPSDNDRAVHISALLTGLQRRLMRAAPMHAFSAYDAGYGKTLMAQMLAFIITGREVVQFTIDKNEEETRKKMMSVLLGGNAVVLIDNVPEGTFVKSPALCSILTAATWGDRILGESRIPKNVKTNCLILATGNNLVFAGDMPRRVVRCTIHDDKLSDTPETRKFKIADLETYIRKNRAALVHAALTLLRAYWVTGQPGASRLSQVGSFEEWNVQIRGAMIHHELGDPWASQTAIRAIDPIRESQGEFLRCWDAAFDGKKLTLNDAVSATTGLGVPPAKKDALSALREAMLTVASDRYGQIINTARLGYFCRNIRNRVIKGFQFLSEQDDKTGTKGLKPGAKVAQWHVEQVANRPKGEIKPAELMSKKKPFNR